MDFEWGPGIIAMEIIIWLEKMVKCGKKCFWRKLESNWDNAIASLFKSSIGKTDRFLESGRVWSLKSENEITLIIFFVVF